MATLGIISADEEDRLRLSTLAGESGHQAHAAAGVDGAVEILRERRPQVLLVVDQPGQDAEILVREISRVAPLLPVIVALKIRDADRAVKLMRLGAFEVVAPPWTREDLKACLSKSLRAHGTSLSAVRLDAPRRPGPVYFFAVLLFLAACFGALALKRRDLLQTQALERAAGWDIPSTHPAGLAFDKGKLWVLDWYTQSLYGHNPEAPGSISGLVHFSGGAPLAVAFGKDSAWSVTLQGDVIRHLKDPAMTPAQTFPGAAPRASGMAYDGLYLWTCDAARKILRKHLVDDRLTVLANIPYPGERPAALAFDGQNLWSLESFNRELLRHDPDNPHTITKRVKLHEYRDGRTMPIGLAWDGSRFWTLAERLPRDSGSARLLIHQAIESSEAR